MYISVYKEGKRIDELDNLPFFKRKPNFFPTVIYIQFLQFPVLLEVFESTLEL